MTADKAILMLSHNFIHLEEIEVNVSDNVRRNSISLQDHKNQLEDKASHNEPTKMSTRLQRSRPKKNAHLYDTVRVFNTLEETWTVYYQIRPEPDLVSNVLVGDGIEVYHCAFCNYFESVDEVMEDHYYHNHDKELIACPGSDLGRKINLLMINGDKSYGDINKRYRLWPNLFDCLEPFRHNP